MKVSEVDDMQMILGKVREQVNLALSKGFFHLLSANLLIQIAGFGGQIFLTRTLSVEEIGYIKVLQTYLGIALIISSIGINTAVLKLCSEKIDEQQKVYIFNLGVKINILTSFLLVLIVSLLAHFNLLSSNTKINELLKIFLLQVPTLTLSGLSIMYLQAKKKVKQVSYVQSVSKIVIIIVSIFSAYLFGFIGYIHSLILTNLLTLFFLVPLLKEELINFFREKIRRQTINLMVKVGGFAFGSNLLGNMLMNFNVILVNILINDPKEMGYYGIAQLIITTLMMIPSTLNQIMVPHISEASGDLERIKDILKRFQKRAFFLIITVAISTAILVPLFLPIVFGEEYKHSTRYFEILLIGVVFWSLYSPKGVTLLSIGRTDLNFYTSLIAFVVNLLLNFTFIKIYGMVGAAIANTSTYFITIFINDYFYKQHFKGRSL